MSIHVVRGPNAETLHLPTRKQMDRFQELASQYPQFEPETKHYFSEGMYCREVTQPEGSVVIGKEHLKPHFFLLTKGEMTIVGEGYRKRVKAPYTFVSNPGDKRALYAHVDSVYVTIHKTDKTDLDEIEKELIREDDRSLFDSHNKLKFDVPKFRELTLCVIANEKRGFWSDWTPEQQRLYESDDWEAFSRSRGYTEKQIEEFRLWLKMTADAKSKGLNPYAFITDLALAAAADNLSQDTKGEIQKSTRIPRDKS
jgi:hypothetical protein